MLKESNTVSVTEVEYAIVLHLIFFKKPSFKSRSLAEEMEAMHTVNPQVLKKLIIP